MLDKIKVIPANKDDEAHRKGAWIVKNENINFSRRTTEKISFEDHCIWWDNNFDKFHFYIVLFEAEVIGYIRIPKDHPNIMDKNEISIALKLQYRDKGLGSYAYSLFESYMKDLQIPFIVAHTHVNNKKARFFFEKNGFKKEDITLDYIKYVKKF